MGKDLHYSIYYSLILRSRRYMKSVIELLRGNNYVPSEVSTIYSLEVQPEDFYEDGT